MGNSNSASTSSANGNKVRQKSDNVEIKRKPSTVERNPDFPKSKSMMELGNKGGRKSIGSLKTPRELAGKKELLSAKSSANGLSRSKSIRRDGPHPITLQAREIVSQCMDNPHSEFGNKVLQRIFEKRTDFQTYVYALGKEKSHYQSTRLKELVENVINNIHDPDYIATASRAYGEEHVELKAYGFKPDFWVSIADAMTVEGVILDQANHQPADTVSAWSSLVSLIFTSVRDGYYSALRKHRMSSKRSIRRQTTCESNGGNGNGNGYVMETSYSQRISKEMIMTVTNGDMTGSYNSQNANALSPADAQHSLIITGSIYSSKTTSIPSLSSSRSDSLQSQTREGIDSPPVISSRSRPIFE
ncbi:hypothetical protein WR25_00712 [Diploscapter pachys]|uniref:Globin family profile domain-containing protein n=1 Tax=Diploscapter pachys TaxID=2018661 RepID=A0A2A2LC71_9BILA|nr:hypothetical protein WR25_00712 [Diploscapter pachys]